MFQWLDANLILLLIFIVLGVISQNYTMVIAVVILLIIRYTSLKPALPWIEANGLTVSITLLTIAVLTPMVSGKVDTSKFFANILDWKLIAAICVGALVSWLGGRGVSLMTYQPKLITGLLVGTVIGVAVFRGVAVGPLIAAGILSMVLLVGPE